MSCYAWELAVLSAFVEQDSSNVRSRIADARSTIARRMAESVPVTKEEFLKIESALIALEALEEERAGPSIASETH
jgi:hypothetical protein